MIDTTERMEVFGKRGWYYSWGAFMLFDAGVHFFAACLLVRILWAVASSSARYTYVSDPESREDIIVIIVGCCYCVAYGVMCLAAARYCLVRLKKALPVILVDNNGIVVDTIFLSYSIDWKNVSSLRSGKFPAGKRYTAISLKSEHTLYSKKHSLWLRLDTMVNRLLYKAPIILPSTSVVDETQLFSFDKIVAFYEEGRS